MHAGTRRVSYDNIRLSVFFHKFLAKGIFNISGNKFGIIDFVDFRVNLCIGNSFLNIFDTYYFFTMRCNKVGNGVGSGVGSFVGDFDGATLG